jgi:hypothetical protein
MQKIISFKGTCKNCNKIFAESKTPHVQNMPTTCDVCKHDTHVIPVFEEDHKGLTYEITIFRKETGALIKEGISITYDDAKNLDTDGLIKLVQLRLCEVMLKTISAHETQNNQDNIKKLIT